MTTILAGTRDGIHTLGGPSYLQGHDVAALARGGAAIWAIVDGREVWRDRDQVSSSRRLRLNCLGVADGTVIAGTSDAHLLRLDGGDLRPIEPFDQAEGRDDWYTPWGGPPDVRSIARGADGALYVNVHVGGIVRSPDGGRTWSPTIDIDTDVHQVIAHPQDPLRVLAATAYGLADSADGGRTWTVSAEGMHATYCRAVALAGDTVLVSCSRGPRGGQAAVYRRPLSADPDSAFERCRSGLPEWFPANIDTACLDAAGANAAFGTAAGEVFVSEDAGQTWERRSDGLPAVHSLLLA
jgi:hypothetical protein